MSELVIVLTCRTLSPTQPSVIIKGGNLGQRVFAGYCCYLRGGRCYYHYFEHEVDKAVFAESDQSN